MSSDGGGRTVTAKRFPHSESQSRRGEITFVQSKPHCTTCTVVRVRARLYACTVVDWRLGFVDDWRLGRRALKIQIYVMPPLPVRTPQELPEALKKTFGSAEEFVKETGSYFEEENAVLVQQSNKPRGGRRGVVLFRCARGLSPGKTAEASVRCECDYKIRLLKVEPGRWKINWWSLHHTNGCRPTDETMRALNVRSGNQVTEDLVRELVRVFSVRDIEPTLGELRSYICQVIMNFIIMLIKLLGV